QGVTLIRLPDDEKLVGLVRLDAEDDEGGIANGEAHAGPDTSSGAGEADQASTDASPDNE
ncbi:MAG TPA: hypothetical protein PLU65_12680, partial [Dokdonella sp.]|nr:hypothetical protein [Dokdonella sp.]